MSHPFIRHLYERLTGRPYITTRSMAAEFGPTLATRHPELAAVPDSELIRRPLGELLAEADRTRRDAAVELDPETITATRRISDRLQEVAR